MTKTFKNAAWAVALLAASLVYLSISNQEAPMPRSLPRTSLPAVRPQHDALQIPPEPNKLLLVNFFASWCSICSQEPPILRRLADLMRDHDGELIGIASGDTRDDLLVSGKLDQRPYRLGLDQTGSYARSLNIDGVPVTILVDQQGKIVYQVRGKLNENHYEVIAQQVTQLADGK